MKKTSLLAAAIVCGVSISGAALADDAPPLGFGFHPYDTGAYGPQGFGGNMPVATVASVLTQSYDDQYVSMKGSLVRYLGDDKYEFSDGIASVIVELDDDLPWTHIRRGQQIVVFGEVDRDWNYVKVEVDRAMPVAQ